MVDYHFRAILYGGSSGGLGIRRIPTASWHGKLLVVVM